MLVDGHLDRRLQLAFLEWLEQVTIGLRDLRPLEGAVVRVRRKIDDRYVVTGQFICRFDAIHLALQIDVHQHQMGRRMARRGDGLLSGRDNDGHIVPHPLQPQLQVQGDDGLVLDDEDPSLDIGSCGLCHGGITLKGGAPGRTEQGHPESAFRPPECPS